MNIIKTILKILQWIYAGAFGVFALANGFHYSTVLLLLAAVLLMPLPTIRKFLKERFKIKTWLAIILAFVLFFAGITLSPLATSTEELADGTHPLLQLEETTPVSTTESTSSTETTEETKETQAPTATEAPAETKPEEKPTGVGAGAATPVSLKKIPAYSGKPYVTVNNNVPNFSAKELTTKGYETYSELDSLGRTQGAVASVGKDTMPKDGEKRGSISSIKPTGWKQEKYTNVSGGWLYNRCHLIGWQLSAENANSRNLITGTKYLNTSGMLPFENMVADYIKETSDHVAYRITPIYDGKNLLASGVQMEAYSISDAGESVCFNVFCYNVQPGVEINYATGASDGPRAEEETEATTKPTDPPTTKPSGSSENVWIPKTGKKYHSKKTCSNMKNLSSVSKETAIKRGYEPCSKCY